MAAGWIITKQHFDDPGLKSRVGKRVVWGRTPEEREDIKVRLANGEGDRWRTLDDDRNVNYEGRMIMDEDSEGFEPLDWTTNDVGDTTIQYWQSGAGGGWKTL